MSEFERAVIMAEEIAQADVLINDKDYDTDWFRNELKLRKIKSRIPTNRKRYIPFEKILY